MRAERTSRNMPQRMLRLLALLQSRRDWSGAELAERLDITERTLRRDIDRLRALDYPVVGTTGIAGGYRLTAGKNLPPLVLTDEEAVAVATGLVSVAGASITGIEDSALQALVKLEQLIPARLKPRLSAVASTTTAVPSHDAPRVDPGVLGVLAACSRDREVVSFDYSDRAGQVSGRRAEPHGLVTIHQFWYLVAYDLDRDNWRTFRVDRIDRPARTHRAGAPRELSAPDAATYLARSFADASYRYTAHMAVQLPVDTVRGSIFGPIPGNIEDHGPECTVRLSADSPELVTQYVAAIAALGAKFSLEAPDEITDRLHRLGRQLVT